MEHLVEVVEKKLETFSYFHKRPKSVLTPKFELNKIWTEAKTQDAG